MIFRADSAAVPGLALVLALSWPQPSSAAQTVMREEPKAFLGVPFGPVYEPDSSFNCETDSEEGVRCVRATDDLHVPGVPIKSLTYLFMEKRLYTVDMEVDGRENFDKIVAELSRIHGTPRKEKGGSQTLVGKDVDILLYYDGSRRLGEVGYVYKNIPCTVE